MKRSVLVRLNFKNAAQRASAQAVLDMLGVSLEDFSNYTVGMALNEFGRKLAAQHNTKVPVSEDANPEEEGSGTDSQGQSGGDTAPV